MFNDDEEDVKTVEAPPVQVAAPAAPVVAAPPVIAAPIAAPDAGQAAAADAAKKDARRRGRASTILTGGLGDSNFGSSVNPAALNATYLG